MFECRGCGELMSGRASRVYCSNACQQEAARQKLVAIWLETGIARAESKRGHYVRRFIMEDQGSRCAICDSADEWQGQPLVFVLDHINGDAEDNRRVNLRLVCPNGDSQAPTYKSRNRGRGRAWRRRRYADGRSF